METLKIKRNKAIELINTIKSKGHSFGVKFIKKNGETRTMLARMGAKPKYQRKTDKPYNAIEYGLLTVLDVNKTVSNRRKGSASSQAYRQINLNTLLCINYGGVSYELTGNEEHINAYKTNAL